MLFCCMLIFLSCLFAVCFFTECFFAVCLFFLAAFLLYAFLLNAYVLYAFLLNAFLLNALLQLSLSMSTIIPRVSTAIESHLIFNVDDPIKDVSRDQIEFRFWNWKTPLRWTLDLFFFHFLSLSCCPQSHKFGMSLQDLLSPSRIWNQGCTFALKYLCTNFIPSLKFLFGSTV